MKRTGRDERSSLVRSTPEVLTERLRGMIHRGELGPGDRLPPERELAEQFGVARVSMRQALARLQHEGYLRARRGAQGGTFVTELTEPRWRWLQAMREDLSDLEDILDYRIAVEARAARLAAMRRTDADLTVIDQAIEQLTGAHAIAAFRSADSAFHQAIAAAARSPRLAVAIENARGELFLPTDALAYPPNIERSAADHGRIARAVRERDGDASVRYMIEHIESTRRWLRDFLEQPTLASVGEPELPAGAHGPDCR